MTIRPTLLALALGCLAMGAHARKDCDELRGEIDAQLQTKGVKAYRLDIVAMEAVGENKVVGQCDGGTRRIVYSRGEAAPSGSTTGGAATKSNGKPPPLGNY